MKKRNEKEKNSEVTTVRYCKSKKCGCELPSDNKGKYCDKCRRERAKNARDTAVKVGGLALVVLAVIPGLKHIGKLKK